MGYMHRFHVGLSACSLILGGDNAVFQPLEKLTGTGRGNRKGQRRIVFQICLHGIAFHQKFHGIDIISAFERYIL